MTEPPGVPPGRAVIDPNVFVSALMAKPGSAALTTAQALATDHLVMVACPYLLAELSEVRTLRPLGPESRPKSSVGRYSPVCAARLFALQARAHATLGETKRAWCAPQPDRRQAVIHPVRSGVPLGVAG